jgi:hypothetical protein
MFGLLALIPGVLSAVTGYFTAKTNAQVEIYKAKTGADTETASKVIGGLAAADHENTSRLGIVAGSKLLTYLIVAFAAPLLWFEWKVIVYDTILGLGSTSPIHGQVAAWANTIINFIFGGSTVLALTGVAHTYFNRKGQ